MRRTDRRAGAIAEAVHAVTDLGYALTVQGRRSVAAVDGAVAIALGTAKLRLARRSASRPVSV
jgi:hypothetical protein